MHRPLKNMFTKQRCFTLFCNEFMFLRLAKPGNLNFPLITKWKNINQISPVIVKKANYSSYLLGGGLKYNLNSKIDLLLSSVYSPEKKETNQPAISFVSAGFSYNLHQLREEKIHEAKKIGYKHPKHLLQMGYSSLVFRYRINNTFSKIPIFWGGESEVNHGISFDYRQNVFHTSKYFSLDCGVGASFAVSVTRPSGHSLFSS